MRWSCRILKKRRWGSTIKVLITGGSGFLGRHIVDAVAGLGHKVCAPRSGECNLEDLGSTNDYFVQTHPEAVIHSAAHYGGMGICTAEPLDLGTRNLRMAANLFEAAAKNNVQKVVSVGSTCGYPGDMPDSDMREEEFFSGRCHGSMESYGFSKRAHLVLMTAAHKQFGVSGSQIALNNLYGEYDVFHEYRGRVIASLIKKITEAKASGDTATAWGTGSPIRQFSYVKDAAETIARALLLPHDDWPVNSGGDVLSIRDLIYKIADAVGFPHDRVVWDTSKPDGVSRRVSDDTKLRKLFPDFVPTPIDEGLRKTVSWYMENMEEANASR